MVDKWIYYVGFTKNHLVQYLCWPFSPIILHMFFLMASSPLSVQWFDSYLQNRTFTVKIGNVFCDVGYRVLCYSIIRKLFTINVLMCAEEIDIYTS